MAMANINKQHFLLAGSCAVVLSLFSRSSVGKIGEGIRGVKEIGILRKVFFAQARVVSPLRRGDGSVDTVVARMESGKKVRIYENSRRVGAAILHILAHERVPFRLLLIPIGAEHT